MSLLLLLWLSLTVELVCGAAFARRANLVGYDISLKSSYDFIVVGGGTSGLTVADRLTENPRSELSILGIPWQRRNDPVTDFMLYITASVLVIEYGYLINGDDAVLVPGLLNNTRYVYNITSVPQRGLDNNAFTVPAGAVVGGGSAVNGMFFDRGSAPDYDAWVKLGNPGWGWKDLLPYFKKVACQLSVPCISNPCRARNLLLPQ